MLHMLALCSVCVNASILQHCAESDLLAEHHLVSAS